MARETRTVHVKVTSNVSSIGKETSKATAQAGGLKGALKGVGAAAVVATGGIRAMVAALMSSGIGAIVVALGSLTAILGSTLRESMNFSKELSGLQAILDADKDAMGDFSKEAKRLGATTAFTASQVVELQTEFAKLGFTKDEIINVTEATLSLAAASGTDLANAAMVAGATLRGLGLDSSQTARVADVMADSFTKSGLNITFFQESMKLVAPTAANLKVSLERSTAALSILADAGIKGSMAGTNLRKVMSELSLKTGKGFRESLTLTKEKMDALTSDTEKMALAKELVGQKSKDTLSILIKNIDQLDSLEKSYNKAEGSAERMAAVQLDNLTGDVTILKSAWSGLLLSFEDGNGLLTKIARGSVKALTGALAGLTKASQFLGFTFGYVFDGMGDSIKSSFFVAIAQFKLMQRRISEFALQAKLSMSDVPILGKLIDKDEVQKNLEDVQSKIKAAADFITKTQAKQDEKRAKKGAFWDGWRQEQARLELVKTEAKSEQVSDEFIEGKGEQVDKELDQEKAKREKFRNTLKKAEEDFEDQTEAEKIERKMNRHIAEMETLGFTETEMRELEQQIRDHYAGLQKEKADEKEIRDNERLDREKQARTQMLMTNLDNAARIAGEETKLGKALLIAKQLLMAKELFNEAKNAIMKAKIRAAESVGSVTAGTAKAAATLNPVVIAGYAITAAGIISSIASAFKSSKEAASAAGVSGGGAAPTVAAQAPSFNVVGQQSAGEQAIGSRLDALAGGALKAYVVEGEVTSAQQLSNQVEETASLG